MATATAAAAIERRFIEDEHARMRAGLGKLQEAIDGIHHSSQPEVIDHVVRTLAWLRRDVLPHAAWEEAWLYPNVDVEAGTPWATRALRLEHDQIRDAAAALEREFQAAEQHWSNEEAIRVAVALTRLETLLVAHLIQEERLLEPVVEAID